MTWSGLTKTGTQYANNDLPSEWASYVESIITFTIPAEIDEYIISDKSHRYAAPSGFYCYGRGDQKYTSTYEKETVSASYSVTSNKAIPKIIFNNSRISNFVTNDIIYSFGASWIDGFSAWAGSPSPVNRRNECSRRKFLLGSWHSYF